MKELKLRDHKGCPCHVEVERKEIRFVSYKTTVVVAKPCGDTYMVQGLDASAFNQKYKGDIDAPYSATTGRQISYFLREYFPSLTYQDMKESAKCENVFEANLASDRKWLVE